MKNNRKVAAFALVLVAAFLIAGIGYAYTSTTSTTGNTLDSEDVLITPGVKVDTTFTPTYAVSTAKDIKYDTEYKADESDEGKLKWFYGIEFTPVDAAAADDQGQSLTTINTLRITNEGDQAKTLTKIVVSISDSTFITQFKENGAYATSVEQLKMKLVDSENHEIVVTPTFNEAGTSMIFEFVLPAENFVTDLPTTDGEFNDYGFSFVIMGDITDAAAPVCTHIAVLDSTAFALKFRAIAADVVEP